jgi:hypothetical protein
LAATWLTAGLLVAALLLAPALANADERFQKLRTGLSLAEASASTENYPTSGLDLMPSGTINSSAEMIFRPFNRVAYSHTHESTTGEIKTRLAGTPDGVTYFNEVLPFDDNIFSLSVGVDTLASRQPMLRLNCDRQIATSQDTESFFAKVMFTM